MVILYVLEEALNQTVAVVFQSCSTPINLTETVHDIADVAHKLLTRLTLPNSSLKKLHKILRFDDTLPSILTDVTHRLEGGVLNVDKLTIVQ